jgi:putative PIG3 family NAD(P)H quinone oxidoreductase
LAPSGATDILGLEAAGTVVALGSHITTVSIGDQVCALVNGGAYADYVIAQAELTLPIPDGLDLREAAALPEALFTAWHNLVDICQIAAGDFTLIHGGASGVGTIAIQLARSCGSIVFATAGSDERCRFVESIGAKRCFNYHREDFVRELMLATQSHGMDIILDMAGGTYAEKNLQALAYGGRITHLSSGHKPVFSSPLALIMQKEARITGSLLRPLAADRKAALACALRQHVWPKIGIDICPILDREFALDDTADAHRYMEAGLNKGKILLKI